MEPTPGELRRKLPSFAPVLTTAILLSAIGWIGLVLLFLLTLPTLGPRWLLYFLVAVAVSGMVLPGIHYLHRRFPGKPVATSVVMIREALLVGAFADTLLWLQLGKVLNLALAILIGACLAVIEVLLRLREKSQWTPPPAENE